MRRQTACPAPSTRSIIVGARQGGLSAPELGKCLRIKPGLARSGVGTKLMQTAINWLRERGAPRVILWTAAPNEIAHTLFRQLGFRDTMIEMTMEMK